ncbi:MAG: N-(5'-phosphoribosyl)anthranilate isomerase [Candidatus Marinimicrobia bacterium]|nr:N-(5'-phosphoribosyl)anthranilate isomerase [Candidatus Neomarinimicrobiota bacterium]
MINALTLHTSFSQKLKIVPVGDEYKTEIRKSNSGEAPLAIQMGIAQISVMIQILVHGLTNKTDSLVAAKLGANGLGFVLDESDDRYIEFTLAQHIIKNLPPLMSIFVQPDNFDPDYLQSMVTKLQVSSLIVPVGRYTKSMESLGCRVTATGTSEALKEFVNSADQPVQIAPTDASLDTLHELPEDELRPWRELNQAHHLLLPCTIPPKELTSVLHRFKPAALLFREGTQDHAGLQDFPLLQAYIQAVHSIEERV